MTATPATPIQSVVYGTDADLIAEVARLYLKPEHRVADLTWGKGTFWKKVDHPNLIGSDANPTKAPGGNVRNFMATGYDDASFDVVVFDPPYAHTGKNNSQVMTRAQYGLESVASFNNLQILNLYRGGLEECWRIVRPQEHFLLVGVGAPEGTPQGQCTPSAGGTGTGRRMTRRGRLCAAPKSGLRITVGLSPPE